MKIAIPIEEKNAETTVCQSFGRAPYYLLYDTESKAASFIDNGAAASQGGAGIKAAQTLVDSGAKALVTFRCGENAAAVLNAADVAIYKATPDNAMENARACASGSLELLAEIHPGYHNHKGEKA